MPKRIKRPSISTGAAARGSSPVTCPECAAKDRIIGELIEAHEKVILSAPLTENQRSQLASYVTEYLDRGIHGVWYDLATGIAALMADNERLRRGGAVLSE